MSQKQVVVLASGEGTTFEALVRASESAAWQVTTLITNNASAGALQRAKRFNIPAVICEGAGDQLDGQILAALEKQKPDLIVLAGFLKKLGSTVITPYGGRMINTHPSLLPQHGGEGMYGSRVHQSVIKAGDQKSGVTVHWVNDQYDAGQIIDQCQVDVTPEDTAESLSKKIKDIESDFLIQTMSQILQ